MPKDVAISFVFVYPAHLRDYRTNLKNASLGATVISGLTLFPVALINPIPSLTEGENPGEKTSKNLTTDSRLWFARIYRQLGVIRVKLNVSPEERNDTERRAERVQGNYH